MRVGRETGTTHINYLGLSKISKHFQLKSLFFRDEKIAVYCNEHVFVTAKILPSAAVSSSVSGLNPSSPDIAIAVTSSGEVTKA